MTLGQGATTFGWTTDATDVWWPVTTPGPVTAPATLGPFPVLINGVRYPVDLSFEPWRRVAYRHTTIAAQKESVTYDNIPGQGTVNTEGLWQRGQIDWHEGAGEQYLDIERDSQSARFLKSKGVDPFSYPYQLTLLPDVIQQVEGEWPDLKAVRCGTGIYYMGDRSLYFVAAWGEDAQPCNQVGFIDPIHTPELDWGNVNDICSNDSQVYVATSTGIWYAPAGSSGSVFLAFAAPDAGSGGVDTGGFGGGYTMVRWANDQVIAAFKNRLYGFGFDFTVGDAPGDASIVLTHANANWVWEDAVGGETQTYVGGHVRQNGADFTGCVYRCALDTTSSTSLVPWVLDTPVQALPLSPDEPVYSLASYLNYIFVGTARGIRMCQTLSIYDPTATATGDLKAGPYLPNDLTPVSMPVTAIVGSGRYIWFAWSNYDDDSTGLGRLDLTTNINGDLLTPAYCSDLMVTGQGEITSLDWDPNTGSVVFCVAGMGIYTPAQTNQSEGGPISAYVESGSLMTSQSTYGIAYNKVPVYFNYGASFVYDPNDPVPAGEVSAIVFTDPLNPVSTAAYPIDPFTVSTDNTQYALPAGISADIFQTELTLTAGQSDGVNVYTPTLYRWMLQAWPQITSGTLISVVIRNMSKIVQNKLEFRIDPYQTFIDLETLRVNQTIVPFQEGPLMVNVIVTALDWIPDKQREPQYGLEGDLVVSLTTIGPYSYTALVES